MADTPNPDCEALTLFFTFSPVSQANQCDKEYIPSFFLQGILLSTLSLSLLLALVYYGMSEVGLQGASHSLMNPKEGT